MDKMTVDLSATRRRLWAMVAPESNFLWVVVIYGLAISLLTLAVPIAVQTLINTIANIGSLRAIYTLSAALFFILLVSGILSALRTWVVELYERRVFARLVAEMSYRVIRAPHSFFEGRQNSGITDRYFDIMILKRNVPRLLVDGFALVLQMLVGFTLVSFYHPWLFLFNTVVIALIYLIWAIWSRGAKRSAIRLSSEKYYTAKWLNDVEFAHEFFKSKRHVDVAATRTDMRTERFIAAHAEHFGYTYQQTIMFLLLYALGSAGLLGIGGWLVNIGELSIGQLVAAELIMAAIFLGLSRFTTFLKAYYELYGATEKITDLLSIPQEVLDYTEECPTSGALKISNVELVRDGERSVLDFAVDSGQKVFVQCSEAWIQRKMLNALRSLEAPESGWITLGGQVLSDINPFELRQAIYSVDRSLIIECSVREFLQLSAPDATTDDMMRAMQAVNLWEVIEHLPHGIDTRMSVLGAPLQSAEVLRLKLAAAMLAKPKVLILNQRFDDVLETARDQMMGLLESQPFTIMYFTNRPIEGYFDTCIQLSCQLNGADAEGDDSNV